MSEIDLRQPGFTDSTCALKIKNEYKNLKKLEIHDTFIKMN